MNYNSTSEQFKPLGFIYRNYGSGYCVDLFFCLECKSSVTLMDSGLFTMDMDILESFRKSKVCCENPMLWPIPDRPFRHWGDIDG